MGYSCTFSVSLLPIRRRCACVCVCVYICIYTSLGRGQTLFIWLVVCSACARLSFVLYSHSTSSSSSAPFFFPLSFLNISLTCCVFFSRFLFFVKSLLLVSGNLNWNRACNHVENQFTTLKGNVKLSSWYLLFDKAFEENDRTRFTRPKSLAMACSLSLP